MRRPMTARPLVVLVLATGLVAACAGGSSPAESTAAQAPSTSAPEGGDVDTTTTTTAPTTTTTAVRFEPPPPAPIEEIDGWELVWSDEFDAGEIDPANWTFDIGGWGWGNGEAQYYTDRPENARVQDGLLVIELRQEKYEGSYYTSARLKTQGLQAFQYGRIEAKIKVPRGVGTWPAFWMLGDDFSRDESAPQSSNWPDVGEIDIMEHVGREPDLVMGTLHGPGYAGAGGLTRWNRQDYEIADDFHTFAIDWDETGIRWLYDGEEYYALSPDSLGGREWVFDKPFFMILNLALGGSLGGNVALDLELPVYLLVDHVRVYQRVGDQGA